MQLFGISTSSVDNVVDKARSTSQIARIGGHLLELPIPEAIKIIFYNQRLGRFAEGPRHALCGKFLHGRRAGDKSGPLAARTRFHAD
jgi:hypothetical protein